MTFYRPLSAFFQFICCACTIVLGLGLPQLSAEEVIAEYDFESGLQGWSNPNGSYGWQRNSAGTGSSNTGPSIDATGSSSGYYVYMETSNGSGPYTAGQESYFVSPSIVWENSELEFAYHMYGASMGKLHVDVSTNAGSTWTTEWTISGQQHTSSTQAYTVARVDLTSYSGQTLQLRFRGESTATGFTGDMAIDAVKVISVGPPELTLGAEVGFLEGSSSIPVTLTVGSAPVADLVVTLSGDAFLSLPATVTILAGETSANFSFSILDDAIIQGDRDAAITASATDYTSGVHNLTVYDDETFYTVTFDLDGKGTLDTGDLEQLIVWGQSAVEPILTASSGWHFSGWDLDVSNVAVDLTVTAQYLPVHPVTFDLGAYGSLLSGELVQDVIDGQSALAPEFRVVAGWAFVGWNRSYSDVAEALVVSAQYAPSDLVSVVESKLIASDGASGDLLGVSVSVSGDVALVGAYGDANYTGSAYVYTRTDGVWSEQTKLIASDGAANDCFGFSVSLSGDTAVIGAYGDDGNSNSGGSVYVFVSNAGVWSEQAKLIASDGDLGMRFGSAVSVSGDTVVIGASGDDENGYQSGSAYVFVRDRGVWFEQAKLTASDGAKEETFGSSVSVDGDTAVVGAYQDTAIGYESGSAYVYVRSAGLWTEQVKLIASDGASSDYFGYSVSVSGDTAVIGAYEAHPQLGSGSAYVYVRSAGIWTEQAKLVASDGGSGDQFGSVSVSGDTAVVGARYHGENGNKSGSAYVYVRSAGLWTEQVKLIASDGASGDQFGVLVSVSGDTAVIGAYKNYEVGLDSGSVYFYDLAASPVTVTFDLGAVGNRTGGGELIQQVKLRSPAVEPVFDVISGWGFVGWDVDFRSVTADLTVTAQYLPTHQVLFDLGTYGTRIGGGALAQMPLKGSPAIAPVISIADGWTFAGWDESFDNVKEDIYITAQYLPTDLAGVNYEMHYASNPVEYGNFGSSVSMCGNTALVGAAYHDTNGISSGSAFVFVREEGAWQQLSELTASDGAPSDYFGSSVCVYGDTAVVGAYQSDGNGSVYVFVRRDGVWTEQAKLSASDGGEGDRFGYSVSLEGDTIVVGADQDDDSYSNSGSAYVFVRIGAIWTEQAKLRASDGNASDHFGISVSVSDGVILVGSEYGDDDNGSGSGSAYVFVRSGDIWTEQAKLIANDGEVADRFGGSVSLCGDTAVIGAASHNGGQGDDSGSAYVFVRSEGVWGQQAKLLGSVGRYGDYFGYSVSVSGDAVVVGSFYHDDDGINNESGIVYVFKRKQEIWVEEERLSPLESTHIRQFGRSVSIDGGNAVFGATGFIAEIGDSSLRRTGSAFFYDLGVPPAMVTFDLGANGTRTGGGALTQILKVNTSAVAPIFDVADDWHFVGWDVDFSVVTGDVLVTAQYLPTHQVTFDVGIYGNHTGGALSQEIVDQQSAVEPEFDVSLGWFFSKWDTDFSLVTGDLLVTAQYIPAHTVTFDLGMKGSLLAGESVQQIGLGYSAIAPEFAVIDGWAFVGWDHSYDNVTSALTVTAQYAPRDLVGILESKLIVSSGAANDSLGSSVSVCGDTAVVGVRADDDTGVNSGSAYVYVRIHGIWTEQAKLIASDGVAGDFFGHSVSISGDTIVVGAYNKSYNESYSRGAAYVFVRSSRGWVQQAKLVASDGSTNDRFGRSVCVSNDTAVIGAHHDRDSGSQSGSVYVYVRRGDLWEEQVKLIASDGATNDYFGYSVSLSGDTVVIGAYGDDDTGVNSGSAYVYVRSADVWTEQAKLLAADGAADDSFGFSVSVSGDTVLVGAYRDDENGTYSGSGYVFVRNSGVWTEQAKLLASDGVENHQFGRSVSVSGDTIVVSAYGERTYTGSAYVYSRSGGVWGEPVKLTANDGAVGDFFGISVSVRGDTVLVGASGDDDNGTDSGSAYIFDLGVPPVTVTFDLAGKSNRADGGELNQLVKVNTPAIEPAITPNAGWMFDAWDTDFSSVVSDLTVTALYSDSTTSDGDALWDGWEQKYLGGTGVSDGSIDSDGDGDLDEAEFKSGNDPMDRADYFHVMEEAVSPVDGKVTLRFTTNDDVGSRRYRICYTDDLSTTDPWPPLPMGEFIPDAGASTEKTFDAPGASDAYFFKVEAFIQE